MLAAGGVVYGYETDSDLIEKHEFKDASSALVTVTRQYETDRNMIDWIKTEINTNPVTLVSKYDYGLDTLGRRTSVVHTGARPASEPRSAHAIRPSVTTTTTRRGLGMAGLEQDRRTAFNPSTIGLSEVTGRRLTSRRIPPILPWAR